MVTYKDLKDYRYIDRAIAMAQKRLEDVGAKPMLTDKVSGSSKEYPYAPRTFTVSGVDEAAIYRYEARYNAAKKEYDRLVRLKSEIEFLRESVENVRDQMMVEYIIEGKPQAVIARELRMSQSSVSERVLVLCEKLMYPDNSDKTDNSDIIDKTRV